MLNYKPSYNIHEEEMDEVDKIINELPTPRKKNPRGKEKPHYVNNKDFENSIKHYYITGEMSYELGDSLNKIAIGLSYRPNFINYSFKDEMVGDAIIKMYSALKFKKFDLSMNFSAFGYFTQIAWRAFINRIKKEKKIHQTLVDFKDMTYSEELTRYSEQGGHIYIKPEHKESELPEFKDEIKQLNPPDSLSIMDSNNKPNMKKSNMFTNRTNRKKSIEPVLLLNN